MARVTIEDCLKNVDSRFQLVHLAVRRVLQLRNGASPLVDAPKNKEVVVALREIASKRVTIENVRQLEEMKKLPTAPVEEKEALVRSEVQEIMEEAETQFDVSVGSEADAGPLIDQDED